MPLPARPMHVPAGLPIDESTRPELLDVGSANVAARNVRNYEMGSLEKRLGFGTMTADRLDGTTRAAGSRMFSHFGSPVVVGNDTLDSYPSATAKWAASQNVPEAVYSVHDIPSPTADAVLLDTAIAAGMVAIVYGKSETSAALMAVVDAESGAVISPVTQLGAGAGIEGIHAVGAIKDRYFIAIATDTATHTIKSYVFDTSNVATGWVLGVTVTTTLASPYPSICSLTDRVIVAYAVNTGTNRVVAKAIDETGMIDSTTISTATFDPTLVDVDGSSADVVWLAYDLNTALRVIALSPVSLSTVIGTNALISSSLSAVLQLRVCAGDTHNARIWLMTRSVAVVGENPAAVSVQAITIVAGAVARGSNGAADLTAVNAYSGAIATSRPFYRAGRYYVFVAGGARDPEGNDANEQAMCILVDWSADAANRLNGGDLRPVANVEPGLAPRLAIWSKVTALTSDRWIYGMQLIKAGNEITASAAYGSALVEIDFASRDRWQSAEHHGVTVLGGGVVGTWDGADFTELGFLVRPLAPTVSASTGSLTGTYRYVAIFEDVDAAGNIVVSGISDPTGVVTLASQDATVLVSDLRITYRTRIIGSGSGMTQSRVRKAVYRTITGGEPPYYRVGVIPAAGFLVDDTTDTELAAHPKLYAPQLPGTVGESLDRRAPPGLRYPVSYAGMLVGAKGSSLFWSGQEVYGEATWFSPVFELPVSGGGDFTGLAVQDGSVIAFKRDRVFVTSGEIPSDNGAAGGLAAARLVASGLGCIDSNSIVATPLGVFFQSERGIEIFSRSQSVEWIGEPILDTLTAYPVVTSATVDARNGLVRFTLAAAVTAGVAIGTGVAVVYDLTTKSWISVDDMTAAAQSAAYVDVGGRRYAWLDAAGIVHTERDRDDTLMCRDGSDWVAATYTLPSWKLGLQQEQRVFEMEVLFERHSSAGLTIEVAEDYGSFGATTADKVWTPTQVSGVGQVSLRPKSHGSAVQLRIRDTADPDLDAPGSGRGFTFLGISADVAPKQGPTRGTSRINPELRR